MKSWCQHDGISFLIKKVSKNILSKRFQPLNAFSMVIIFFNNKDIMFKIVLSMISIIFKYLGSGHINTHGQTRTLREMDSIHSQANNFLTVLLVLYRKNSKTTCICSFELMEYLKSNVDNTYKTISRNNNKTM